MAFGEIFRTRRVVPRGQNSPILAARVANPCAGFDSSCPLTELAILKQVLKTQVLNVGYYCDPRLPVSPELQTPFWATCMHSLMSCSLHFQQCSQTEDMKLFGDLIVKVSQKS